ncbi:hypothetical protein B484DRAFT_399482 [Ochromonadaceae sp. CCMP2298]|nr:hypothetical protein B484DRAFT_399482 [Ochromonadaceae sp. CCMP2298]
MNVPLNYAGVPAYARITLLVIALNNLFNAITHWFYLPDAGLESIARLDLGSPSPARSIAIGLQRREGQERFWMSCTLIYAACYAPQLTFVLLKLQLLRLAAAELTELLYNPFSFRGKALMTSSGPEQYGFFIDLMMVGLPLLYNYASTGM